MENEGCWGKRIMDLRDNRQTAWNCGVGCPRSASCVQAQAGSKLMMPEI